MQVFHLQPPLLGLLADAAHQGALPGPRPALDYIDAGPFIDKILEQGIESGFRVYAQETLLRYIHKNTLLISSVKDSYVI